ncbi:hypothetical protein [Streptomyces sp. NPDC053048]
MSAWFIIGFLIFGALTVAWLVHTEGVPGSRRGRHKHGGER